MRKIAILLSALLAASCGPRLVAPEWAETGKEINPEYGDVIWFPGTLFHDVKDAQGNTVYRAELNDEQKRYMHDIDISTMQMLFPDSVNYLTPYYHQLTLDCMHLPENELDSLYNVVADEAYAYFHYYMEKLNGGRPYIIAGMSQGAMMVRGILKRMTDEEFAGMKAAYSLGFGLSPEDLECSHIVPAQGEFDKGVTISFNSIASHEGLWPLVYNNSQAIINPVNWRTDRTPAEFVSGEDTVTVQIDSLYNVLMLKGYNGHKLGMPLKESWVEDNRHVEDMTLYAPFIRRNVLDRLYR